MPNETCEAFWEFDVLFDAWCSLPLDHAGHHRGEADGNGEVTAVIMWPNSTPADDGVRGGGA